MPPERLPKHITQELLRALHAPDERLPRYTIVWSEGDVHMEVSYLTDEQQQQRLNDDGHADLVAREHGLER